jgi:hypothetical protein
LVQERAQAVLRVQKVLESANVKLASVATAVLGKSGRAMLTALVGGEQDPEALAALARGRLRAKLPDLRLALEGRVRPVHLVQLRLLLAHSTIVRVSAGRAAAGDRAPPCPVRRRGGAGPNHSRRRPDRRQRADR